MKKCKHCGNLFKFRSNKKYCSYKCQTRHKAINRYYKLKDNPEFKRKNKINFDSWRKKNREHYNSLVTPKANEWQKQRRQKRISQGLCSRCGKIKETDRWLMCLECRIDYRKRKQI